MNCPRCGTNHDKVLESRSNKDGTSVRRRRECLECGFRFTSYEHIERRPVTVVKKDGRHQTFEIGKVERGIITCTEKLNLSRNDIEAVLSQVEDEVERIAEGNRNTITSREIGEATLKALYPVSPVAYVRFASVYRAFDTLDQFIQEIETLKE